MTKLPRELSHPQSFRRFVVLADQDSPISYPGDDEMLKVMYEHLHRGEATKTGWMRRGEEVIAFLERALEGPYSDLELAQMWATSGAQIYFLPKDIRAFLTLALNRVRTFQKQNKAGTFDPFRRPL